MANVVKSFPQIFLLIGLLIALLFRYVTGAILKAISEDIKIVAPDGITQDKWDKITERKGKKTGLWLGRLERIIFFVSFWISMPELIAGWLVFKVGSKWETWSNIVQVPEKIDGVDEVDYLRVRHAWGSLVLQRYLIGTLTNIIGAFIGSAIGQYLQSIY